MSRHIPVRPSELKESAKDRSWHRNLSSYFFFSIFFLDFICDVSGLALSLGLVSSIIHPSGGLTSHLGLWRARSKNASKCFHYRNGGKKEWEERDGPWTLDESLQSCSTDRHFLQLQKKRYTVRPNDNGIIRIGEFTKKKCTKISLGPRRRPGDGSSSEATRETTTRGMKFPSDCKVKETQLTLASWQCSVFRVSTSSGCSDLVGWLTDCRKLSSTPLKVNLFMAAPCWKNIQLTHDDQNYFASPTADSKGRSPLCPSKLTLTSRSTMSSFYFYLPFCLSFFLFFLFFFLFFFLLPLLLRLVPLRTDSAVRNHVPEIGQEKTAGRFSRLASE